MATTASWFHSSMKTVSRSAGRSVVAAAAYRLGERFQDERYATTHDYTRRKGVEATFTVAPSDAPEWAHNPERLWNAAEQAEKRINSTVGREIELALPAFLSPKERRSMAEEFAAELVKRYEVAVSVAIHEPGKGDERNYHAHIVFTTREVTPDGLGKKTRILDDSPNNGSPGPNSSAAPTTTCCRWSGLTAFTPRSSSRKTPTGCIFIAPRSHPVFLFTAPCLTSSTTMILIPASPSFFRL